MITRATGWTGAAAAGWQRGAGAVLLAACAVGGTVPLAAQQRPIIDMHMHTYMPPEHHIPDGALAICRPEPCQRGRSRASADAAENLRRTLEAMDRHNVVRGFLSGLEPEIVQEWTAAAPGRFIPAVFILEAGRPSAETLRREYLAGRLEGMGEIGTQLTGVAPNDPVLEPYFALAEELDIPVLIHTLGIGPYLPGFRSADGNPLLLEDVLTRHPDLRIYMENSGFPYLEETIAMMYQYPQLHGDLSTITWVVPRPVFHEYLEGLIRAGLGKRLMFGSDQMRWPESIGWAIEAIESADFLTEAQKRDIFHDNAARFLGIEGAASQAQR